MCIVTLYLISGKQKCAFGFLVREVRSVFLVRKVRTNQIWLQVNDYILHKANRKTVNNT